MAGVILLFKKVLSMLTKYFCKKLINTFAISTYNECVIYDNYLFDCGGGR